MRIATWDILEFSPQSQARIAGLAVRLLAEEAGAAERGRMGQKRESTGAGSGGNGETIANPKTDLFAPIPHGSGQTILREALLLADHNAYHLGQLVLVRRLLGCWPDT